MQQIRIHGRPRLHETLQIEIRVRVPKILTTSFPEILATCR
jgi:hypothetical protein